MAKATAIPAELATLAMKNLSESGLTLEDLPSLHIDVLAPAQTQALGPYFKALPALRFNYLDPQTGGVLTCMPSWAPFYRLRYLKPSTDLVAVATGKGERYMQPPGSGVCAYFPSIMAWPEISKDARVPLLITEGEKKAAKACKEGYPTIGVGGVYNFRSARLGLSFLHELEAVNWVGRYVYIIFDSDFRTKPGVCDACNSLAEELALRGALPMFVPLPDVVTGGKTGLDDFLVHAKGVRPLDQLLHETAMPLTIAKPLWQLNKEVVYITDPGLIIVQGSGQKMKPEAFKGHAYAHHAFSEQLLNKDGSMSLKKAPLPSHWLQWPLRYELQKLAYAPGQPREITATREWNTWPGWGCQPQKGDAKLFIDLLKHLFTGADPGDLHYFLQWCAYPLQHPGAKLVPFVAFHGHPGTGKSLIAYTLKAIYGKNFVEINQSRLLGDFTEWAVDKSLVLVDDVTGHDSRELYDALKPLSTRKEITINIKYIPSYAIRDCLNYIFTSNRDDAFYLEDKDRRFFIHRIIAPPLEDEFYAKYIKALEYDLDQTGRGNEKKYAFASAVFACLMNYDLTGFNPGAAARMTTAKQLMIQTVKSELGLWVMRLRDEPEQVLKIGQMPIQGDLFTNGELLKLYLAQHDGAKAAPRTLGSELGLAGVPTFKNSQPIITSTGSQRYYVVRNVKKWEKATTGQAVEHVNARYKKGGTW